MTCEGLGYGVIIIFSFQINAKIELACKTALNVRSLNAHTNSTSQQMRERKSMFKVWSVNRRQRKARSESVSTLFKSKYVKTIMQMIVPFTVHRGYRQNSQQG